MSKPEQTTTRHQATLGYYERHAGEYFDRSFANDLSPNHHRFLTRLPASALILDAGCGSARDAQAFQHQGHRVSAFDACAALAELATQRTGIPVQVRYFSDVTEIAAYDGIWASASLLHVPLAELPDTLGRLWTALKPGGTLFVSFKHTGSTSDEARERLESESGRWFTDATPAALRRWLLDALPDVQ